MNIPDTRAFENCLDAINKWSALDNSELSKQLIEDAKFDLIYLEPCRREFSKNMMHMDEQDQNKLIIFSIKELLGTVDKEYVKNRRNAKSDYEDSGFNEEMSLEEYLYKEDKAYEHFDLIAIYQFYLFLDIWGICREYNIQLEKILKDLKIDLQDYFTIDTKRLFTGNKGFPKPEMKIRNEPRPIKESTKTEIAPQHQTIDKEPEQVTNEIRKIKQFIANELDTIDNLGWSYAFTNETDFNLFLDLLACYFCFEPYNIPKTTIKLKRGSKSRLAQTLNSIHKEFSERPLRFDVEFYKLLRIITPFEKMTDIEIYKAITR